MQQIPLHASKLLYLASFSVLVLLSCEPDKRRHLSHTHQVFGAQISLIAIDSQPNIQTPIGLAIDDEDHLYFLESHTHTPLQDYRGPKFDRIKKSIELNDELEPQGWQVFADGISDGMNLAWIDEKIYLVEKKQVVTYKDTDGDGIADEKKIILHMDPPAEVYDHAGLLGIAVSPNERWIYISRGNTGGQRWKITGSDHSFIQGFGDGGSIFRCRLDGSQIESVATGFWNPFDITFDLDGRLFASDNDPDSRGPNRLLEIFMGGDYGYESLYGGSGVHPFLSWNGEFPGTLPYAAALGEAPTGILDARRTNLFSGDSLRMLAQIWEENNIVSIPLSSSKNRVFGKPAILVQGNHEFHPVAFAVNSQGDIYFTDWVVRQYPNHGRGKLWKLENTSNTFTRPPLSEIDSAADSQKNVLEIFQTGNAFEQHLARRQLIRDTSSIFDLLASPDASLNIQGMILAKDQNLRLTIESLERLIAKKEASLSVLCFKYIGRMLRDDAEDMLRNALLSGHIEADLVPAYLETIRHLSHTFKSGIQTAKDRKDPRITARLSDGFLWDLIRKEQLSSAIRARIIKELYEPEKWINELLDFSKKSADELVDRAITQVTYGADHPILGEWLVTSALDTSNATSVRAASVTALSFQSTDFSQRLLPLLSSKEDLIRYAAQWYLCDCQDQQIVNQAHQLIEKKGSDLFHLATCLGIETDQYHLAPSQEERVAQGAIIYQLRRHQCVSCHKINGIGGVFGPDLSHIGSSKTKSQLRTSILDPSAEIAPEWQGWYLVDEEGKTHVGRQIDIGLSSAKLMHENGQFVTHHNPSGYGVLEISLMPDNLEQNMNEEAFEDLIAFLASLK